MSPRFREWETLALKSKTTCPGFPAISHRDRVFTKGGCSSDLRNPSCAPLTSLPPLSDLPTVVKRVKVSLSTTKKVVELIWHLKDLHLKVGFLPPETIIAFSKWMDLFEGSWQVNALDSLENGSIPCVPFPGSMV